jgi:hypothetical protein
MIISQIRKGKCGKLGAVADTVVPPLIHNSDHQTGAKTKPGACLVCTLNGNNFKNHPATSDCSALADMNDSPVLSASSCHCSASTRCEESAMTESKKYLMAANNRVHSVSVIASSNATHFRSRGGGGGATMASPGQLSDRPRRC